MGRTSRLIDAKVLIYWGDRPRLDPLLTQRYQPIKMQSTEIDAAKLSAKSWEIKATTYSDAGDPILVGVYPISEAPSTDIQILFNQHRAIAIEALALEEEVWKDGDIIGLNFKYELGELSSVALTIKLAGEDNSGGTLKTRYISEVDKRQFAAVLRELEKYRTGFRSVKQLLLGSPDMDPEDLGEDY